MFDTFVNTQFCVFYELSRIFVRNGFSENCKVFVPRMDLAAIIWKSCICDNVSAFSRNQEENMGMKLPILIRKGKRKSEGNNYYEYRNILRYGYESYDTLRSNQCHMDIVYFKTNEANKNLKNVAGCEPHLYPCHLSSFRFWSSVFLVSIIRVILTRYLFQNYNNHEISPFFWEGYCGYIKTKRN